MRFVTELIIKVGNVIIKWKKKGDQKGLRLENKRKLKTSAKLRNAQEEKRASVRVKSSERMRSIVVCL